MACGRLARFVAPPPLEQLPSRAFQMDRRAGGSTIVAGATSALSLPLFAAAVGEPRVLPQLACAMCVNDGCALDPSRCAFALTAVVAAAPCVN